MSAPKADIYAQGGAGPNLVLIHGFGADRYSWAANAPMLTDAATVWAVDLPGHGEATNEVGAGDPETLAHAVAVALEELSGPIVVAGHSLGGAVALHLARIAPGRVKRLVLIAPAGLGTALNQNFLDFFPELETPEDAQALLERLVERKRLIVPAMVSHVLATLGRSGRRDALRKIARSLAEGEVPPLPEGVPIDLIWGSADAINPLRPNGPGFEPASLLIVPGAGHLPQVEAASKVNAVIRNALAV